MKVARLPEERWQEAKDLRLRALRSDPIAFGSAYEEEEKLPEAEWRRRTHNMLVVISDDNNLVGTITYLFGDRIKTKHIAHIYGVYVTPEFRGKGLGRKLLESALEGISKNEGIVKVQLTVNTKQEAAVRMYTDFGFQIAGQLASELKVGDEYYDELVMEKMLRRQK